jgi:peptidoglycan hydrolase-like protein with peptidoglycan-binding domain
VTERRGETAAAPLLGAEPLATAPRMSTVEMEAFVRRLQVALLVQGYDPGPVNGVLGEQTQAALKLFQGAMGLTVTGYMDRDTLKGLGLLP